MSRLPELFAAAVRWLERGSAPPQPRETALDSYTRGNHAAR